ncbi:GxxExxY protein [Endozoicomonas atrinae]|uniref:GxxExxY protein n=1 Tax=Endozoicomonas atrinae TaxID=1333660 RepID=UPI003AFFF365
MQEQLPVISVVNKLLYSSWLKILSHAANLLNLIYFCSLTINRDVGMKTRSNQLSELIIGCAIEVHRVLGPGLLKSIYEEALFFELKQAGLNVERKVAVPVNYKDKKLNTDLKLDLLVDDLVIVELKAVDRLNCIHDAQLLTYLKMKNLWLGLLINFNEYTLKQGIKRLVN